MLVPCKRRLSIDCAGVKLGPALLYFGCRKKSHDYIYEQELAQLTKLGAVDHLFVAFSRDGAEKDYVQHHMRRNSTDLWELLKELKGGHFYVCGDAKHMAKDVHKALLEIVQEVEGVSSTQAESVVKQITDANRYMRDVW